MPEPAQERPAAHDLAADEHGAPSERRQARAHAPLEQLGEWDEGDRGHDALETLLAQNAIRVPELLPIDTSAWRCRLELLPRAAAVMAPTSPRCPTAGSRCSSAASARPQLRPVGHPGAEPLVRLARLRRDIARPFSGT